MNRASFENLPRDVLWYMSQNNPAIWPVMKGISRKTRSVALESFSLTNERIVQKFQRLFKLNVENADGRQVIVDRVHWSMSHHFAFRTFKRLWSKLRQEAIRLESVLQRAGPAHPLERGTIELINDVVEKEKIARNEDFSRFANNVATVLRLVIPKHPDLEIEIAEYRDNSRILKIKSTEVGKSNKHSVLEKYWVELKKNVRLLEIKTFGLNNSGLRFLPREILSLTNLQELYLQNNKLNELPEELGSLKNITLINLDNNCFAEVPQVLDSLPKLNNLRMRNNRVKYMVSLSNTSLISLDLSSNPLAEIPSEMLTLRKLRSLFLNETLIKKASVLLNSSLLPELKMLALQGTNVDDVNQETVNRHPTIEKVFIGNSVINKTVGRVLPSIESI